MSLVELLWNSVPLQSRFLLLQHPQVTEIDDAFSFADMDDDIVTEIAEAPVEKTQQIGTGWEPVNERDLFF